MQGTDPRVDAYIANAADFAKPILEHLRGLVHEACPEVTETIKWRNPAFEHHGPLCGMSAFKSHCWFAFWKAPLLAGERGIGDGASPLDQFGRLTTVADLPSRATLLRLIRKAARLNETGATLPRAPRAAARGRWRCQPNSWPHCAATRARWPRSRRSRTATGRSTSTG